MPSSGIEVSPALASQWNELRSNQSINYIIIGIEKMESFAVTSQGSSNTPAQTAQGLLVKESPAYVLIRATEEKFYIVFYVPLGCKNALKMVYSSSLNALKSGLGTDYLSSEIYITSKEELTQEALDKSTLALDRYSLMTQQEQLAHDSTYSNVGLPTESKISAELPIKISSGAQNAMESLKQGTISTGVFTLNTDTEELEVQVQGNDTAESLQSKLNQKLPAFIYMRYAHTNPETQSSTTTGVFIYFCPSGANIKSKMFHSSAKSVVIKWVEQSFPKEFGFECDGISELTTDHIMKTIYPPSQQVVRVAKPVPPHLRRKAQQ